MRHCCQDKQVGRYCYQLDGVSMGLCVARSVRDADVIGSK
jgi:hypothetical protein